MSNIYITQYAIGFISPAILSLTISGTIFLRQLKSGRFTPDRTSLAVYFFGASVYNILNFLGFSIYSPEAQIIWYIETCMPFVVLFIIRFAYYYPSEWHNRERKIVLSAGSVLAAASVIEYWINSWNSPVRLYGQTYGAEYHSSAIPLVIAVFYLWAAIVFIRRAADYEKDSGARRNILSIITAPETRDAKTARTFAGLILLDIVHSFIVYGLMNRVPVSAFVISFSTTLVVLVILSLYATVYLHSAYDNIPFLYKLTGIPLIIILMIITTSGYMMMYFRSISYDEMNRALIPGLITEISPEMMEGNHTFSYISAAGDSAWNVLYDKNGSIPEVITSGLWEEPPSGVQMKKSRGLTDFGAIENDRKYFIQIDNINYNQYNRRTGDKLYGFGILYLDYLKYMHKTGRLILTVMIGSMLLIITLLPVLYYFGITGPLRRIIRKSSGSTAPAPHIENELHYLEKIMSDISVNRKSRSLPEKPDEISAGLRKKLDAISVYLDNNYHDDISREGLASLVGLDPDYISRLFKIYTGQKIGEYINKLRIEEASHLLISTDKSVIDISMLSGFESLRTFNRAFFRLKGETPTSFRNKNRNMTGQNQ